MHRSGLMTVPLAVAALALGLAACGGGESDEDQISEVVETSVLTTDPADCTKLQTQRFVEQTNFAVGEDAVAQCEEDVKDPSNDPDSVEVSAISVDGENATADVSFSGGTFGGSTVTVALVKEGDQWKMDRMTAIKDLDLASFKESFASQFEDQAGIPASVKNCIVSEINAATKAEITQALLSGSQGDLVALFGDCLPS